jgi:membrane protease YdiL (CAAX protease family)
VLVVAFLAIWIPYEAAVGLQERFQVGGAIGPALMALSLLIAFLASWWLARPSLPDPFGLRFDRWTVPIIIGGIAVTAAGRWLLGHFAVSTGIAANDPSSSAAILGSFALALAIGAVPALAEDILTRGFPLFATGRRAPAILLILVSAAMYALNHIWRLDAGFTEQVRLFCMGIAYAAAAWRMRSLWAAFGLHLGWNAGGALVPLDIVGTDEFRLATAAIHLVIAALVFVIPRRERDS